MRAEKIEALASELTDATGCRWATARSPADYRDWDKRKAVIKEIVGKHCNEPTEHHKGE